MQYKMFNIHDFKVPWYFKIIWSVETYIFNYYSIVIYNVTTIKLGNIRHNMLRILLGFMYASKTLVVDYETLEEDLYIFTELKELFPNLKVD